VTASDRVGTSQVPHIIVGRPCRVEHDVASTTANPDADDHPEAPLAVVVPHERKSADALNGIPNVIGLEPVDR
jgi:hypothetical protein